MFSLMDGPTPGAMKVIVGLSGVKGDLLEIFLLVLYALINIIIDRAIRTCKNHRISTHKRKRLGTRTQSRSRTESSCWSRKQNYRRNSVDRSPDPDSDPVIFQNEQPFPDSGLVFQSEAPQSLAVEYPFINLNSQDIELTPIVPGSGK